MKTFKRSALITLLAFTTLTLALPSAAANDDPRSTKNEYGAYTVRCAVAEDTGKLVGYVVGNSESSPEKAKRDALAYISKFGDDISPQRCTTKKRYASSGAFDHDYNPL